MYAVAITCRNYLAVSSSSLATLYLRQFQLIKNGRCRRKVVLIKTKRKEQKIKPFLILCQKPVPNVYFWKKKKKKRKKQMRM